MPSDTERWQTALALGSSLLQWTSSWNRILKCSWFVECASVSCVADLFPLSWGKKPCEIPALGGIVAPAGFFSLAFYLAVCSFFSLYIEEHPAAVVNSGKTANGLWANCPNPDNVNSLWLCWLHFLPTQTTTELLAGFWQGMRIHSRERLLEGFRALLAGTGNSWDCLGTCGKPPRSWGACCC